jgi:hypothetical protein
MNNKNNKVCKLNYYRLRFMNLNLELWWVLKVSWDEIPGKTKN